MSTQNGNGQLATVDEQSGGAVVPSFSERSKSMVNDRGLQLASMRDMIDFAKIVNGSGLAPKGLDTEQKIFVALAMGSELGLSPMQSVQNIGVINGRPGPYGDAVLGLVRASGIMAEFDEWLEDEAGNVLNVLPKNPDDGVCAVCRSRRADQAKPRETRFSVGEAKTAGIWGNNVWKNYPQRMIMFRARGFNLRDQFPEVLRGIKTYEELSDYPETNNTPPSNEPPTGRHKVTQPRPVIDAEPPVIDAEEEKAHPEASTSAAITPEQLKQYDERRAFATQLGLTPPGALKLDADPRKLTHRTELLEKMIAEQEALNASSDNDSSEPSEEDKRAILEAEAAEANQDQEPEPAAKKELPAYVTAMLDLAKKQGLDPSAEAKMLEGMAEVTFANTQVEVPESLAVMTKMQAQMASLDIKAGRLKW